MGGGGTTLDREQVYYRHERKYLIGPLLPTGKDIDFYSSSTPLYNYAYLVHILDSKGDKRNNIETSLI